MSIELVCKLIREERKTIRQVRKYLEALGITVTDQQILEAYGRASMGETSGRA